MTNYHVDIQIACKQTFPVSQETIVNWVIPVLQEHCTEVELTLRFVEVDEMIHLNTRYRKQNKPTNVLAFPSELPKSIALEYPLLGDVVVCPDVLRVESAMQHKLLQAHWAHIIMHGVLHLLGYDHVKEKEEQVMQEKEIAWLAHYGFANPYLIAEEVSCERG